MKHQSGVSQGWARVGLGFLYLACFLMGGKTSGSQAVAGKHDLSGEIKIFDNYLRDFQAAEKTLHGEDFETTEFLEDTSRIVDERLHALKYTLQIYDAISCKPDKEKVKRLVKEQLDLDSYLINSDADRVAGMLSFVKVPAIAQTGLKMKDDMRLAKEKLDAIAASLG